MGADLSNLMRGSGIEPYLSKDTCIGVDLSCQASNPGVEAATRQGLLLAVVLISAGLKTDLR